MKTAFLIAAFCVGLSLANLNIPLKSKSVTTDLNGVSTVTDSVLYAQATVTALGAATKTSTENVVFDVSSTSNYVLSAATTYNDAAVSTDAFNCNVQCENGTQSTNAVSVLDGKVVLNGGVTLKDVSQVTIDEANVSYNLLVPTAVDASVAN